MLSGKLPKVPLPSSWETVSWTLPTLITGTVDSELLNTKTYCLTHTVSFRFKLSLDRDTEDILSPFLIF